MSYMIWGNDHNLAKLELMYYFEAQYVFLYRNGQIEVFGDI